MIIHKKKLMLGAVVSLSLVLAALGVYSPKVVQADVGVRPILPGGGSISSGEETPIEMAAETVVMTVRQATEADNALVNLNPQSYGFNVEPVWYEAVAEVEADFTMRNPTSDPLSMTVWFPLASAVSSLSWHLNPGEIVPEIANFAVSVNGSTVEHAVSLQPNPMGADKPMLPWATFTVDFAASADTNIHVGYIVPLSPAAKDCTVTLYYVFQTGAGWAGSIGRAELIVNLPYPASEETMADMTRLTLPYGGMGQVTGGLPAGVEVNGNQAKWTWTDFEPLPKDDFKLWLLKPGKWNELQAAREQAQTNPQDGQAWLNLAYNYHSMTASFMSNYPLLFHPVFLQQAMDAYSKASKLMPNHPAPYLGLGMLALSQYYHEIKSTPISVIQSVQRELVLARELTAANPDLMKGSPVSAESLEFTLNGYFYNDATATADKATLNAVFAGETEQATIESATRTIWAAGKQTSVACMQTPGADCTNRATATFTPTDTLPPTLTSSPLPSFTSLPPTPTPTPEGNNSGNGLVILILSATGLLILLAAGSYLVRRWKRHKKQ